MGTGGRPRDDLGSAAARDARRAVALRGAVTAGIRAFCAQMTRGLGIRNFGLPAFDKLADALVDPKDTRGWLRFFPPGPLLGRTLLSVFRQIETRERAGSALRGLYAEFLGEAAEILGQRGVAEVAVRFRESARLWSTLGETLLLAEARRLALEGKHRFIVEGHSSSAAQRAQDRRFAAVTARIMTGDMEPARAKAFYTELRERVRHIRDVEAAAITLLHRLVGD